MLTIQFYGKYPCPHLAPIACVYGCEGEQGSVAYNDFHALRAFVEQERRVDFFIPVTNVALRAETCDAVPDIANRYAFTGVCLMNVQEPSTNLEFWETMGRSLKVIRWMRKQGLQEPLVSFLEHSLWTSLTPERKDHVARITGRFLQQWSAEVATKYYAPDYAWKTGERCGQTTVEWMKRHWENHTNED